MIAQRLYEAGQITYMRTDSVNLSELALGASKEEIFNTMGEDSVKPFLGYEGKWVILLALTSNKGSHDFQFTQDAEGERLFEKVLRKSQEWGSTDTLMYVVGATQGSLFADIRKVAPDHFLLVPGVGAQGGDLNEVCKYGLNNRCGLIVNSSRQILYAAKDETFAGAARKEALKVQVDMERILCDNKLIG